MIKTDISFFHTPEHVEVNLSQQMLHIRSTNLYLEETYRGYFTD